MADILPVRHRTQTGGNVRPPLSARFSLPLSPHSFPSFTPTALNSGAQRRVAHAGSPIAYMIEPQRGSTNNFQNALGLIHCGTPLGFVIFVHFNPVCAERHWALEWNCFAVHCSVAFVK